MNVRAETAVYTAAAIVVPASSALASRVTVPAIVVAALVLLGLRARRRHWPSIPGRSVLVALAVLIGWAALSNVWSIAPSWRGLAALAGILVAGIWITACIGETRESFRSVLVTGILLGILTYAFEAISGAWTTRAVHGFDWRDVIGDTIGGINVRAYLINGTVILSLLIWPVLAGLVSRRERVTAVGIVAAVVAAVAYFGSDTGLLALGIGACAWLAAARWGVRAARAAAVLFVLFVLAAPFAAQRVLGPLDLGKTMVENPQVPQSAFVRLFIWKFVAERISERPILGWGFDAARRIPGGGESYVVEDAEGRVVLKELYLPLHPHNQILQVWLELGALGALVVAALGAMVIWKVGSLEPTVRSAALGFAATVVCYAALSFGAWQSWWIAAVLLGVVFLTAARPTPPHQA